MARVLDETGSFSSTQKSLEFVREVALERIEPMIRIAQRLEAAFMVDVTSSDMTLLFEAQDVVFDEARMTNEFGSNNVSELCQRWPCSNADEQERFILVRFEERI